MKWKLGGLINLLILIKDLNKDSNGNSDEREYHGNKSRIQFNLPNPSPLLPPPPQDIWAVESNISHFL